MSSIPANKTAHPWSKAALLGKAQRYAQEMLNYSPDDWRFGLLSTFVLEFLARAACAHISPALLAADKGWENLHYALGRNPIKATFRPQSANITSLLAQLSMLVPDFTRELNGPAQNHIDRRNEELHSGGTPFDGPASEWLSTFYRACSVLVQSSGENLAFLFGEAQAKAANAIIIAALDESAKAVNGDIARHKKCWENTIDSEQANARGQASLWATRHDGHRVKCPACGSDALVFGAPITEPTRKLDQDIIVTVQECLPEKFECVACRLKLTGLSRLTACGLGSQYKITEMYDAAEYYAPDESEARSPYAGYEEDNNEP